jgi:glycosyltransferase involved in cell wall biosynthesis
MKTINFVLPGPGANPIGGYKIVYEYANRLIKDGYKINIIHSATLLWKERDIKTKIKGIIKYPYFKMVKKKQEPYNWFPLDKKINLYWVPTLEEKYIPDADITFATACETAVYVNQYGSKKGEKYYLIQHFEDWYFSKERVLETWKFQMEKIVIAKWLEKIGKEISVSTTLINNGLDFEKFSLDIPYHLKNKKQIIMLYHNSDWKGSKIGLQAIEKIKKVVEDLEVILFGVPQRPDNLPKYIQYYNSPTQEKLRELYNNSAIFLGTSYGEGWGLTVSEAMQCGCAVVCTDVNGYNEMVCQEKTGLLSKAGDSEGLAENIIRLMNNDELRIKLAKNGNEFIQQFTWERAYGKFKALIEKREVE